MPSLRWSKSPIPFPLTVASNLRSFCCVDIVTAVLVATGLLLLRNTTAHASTVVEHHRDGMETGGTPTDLFGDSGESQHLHHRHHRQPLKICLLVEPSPFSYTSGYANRFQELIHYLVKNGDTVEVITTEAVNVHHRVSEWRGVPVHHTFGVRLPWYPLLSVSMDWTLQIPRVLRRFQPDLIHVSSPGLLVLAAALYAKLWGIPLVASYHTHLPVYVRSHYLSNAPTWAKSLLEQLVWSLIGLVHGAGADLTVVPSPQIRNELIAHAGIDPERIHVWNKGIDTERFHPHYRSDMWRRHLEELLPKLQSDSVDTVNYDFRPPSTFWLLYVGRLGREKRLHVLKDVLQQLPRNVALCFVGTGPDESNLKRHFHDTRTIFVGQLHGTNLSQAFASADAFVMPSDSETLGFVVLESLASGVPVVALKAGGLIDLIHDNVTGYFVDPTNENAEDEVNNFVRRIRSLMEDPTLREKMGRNARIATLPWSWEASMAQLRSHDYPAAIHNFHCRPRRRHHYHRRWSGWTNVDSTSTPTVLEGVHDM